MKLKSRIKNVIGLNRYLRSCLAVCNGLNPKDCLRQHRDLNPRLIDLDQTEFRQIRQKRVKLSKHIGIKKKTSSGLGSQAGIEQCSSRGNLVDSIALGMVLHQRI